MSKDKRRKSILEIPSSMIKEEGETKFVSWETYRILKRFPSLMVSQTSCLAILSPNFQYMLDVDYNDESFVVRDLANRASVIYTLPTGMLSLSTKGASKSKAAVTKLSKRLAFYDNSHLWIINKGGQESLLNFLTGNVIASAQIDNFEVNYFGHKHHIHDKAPLAEDDSIFRLMRISERHKTTTEMVRC